MKKLISLIFIVTAFTMASQPKKVAKMAPITSPGYYLSSKVPQQIKKEPPNQRTY